MSSVDQVVAITHLDRSVAETLVHACGGDANAAIAAHFDGSSNILIAKAQEKPGSGAPGIAPTMPSGSVPPDGMPGDAAAAMAQFAGMMAGAGGAPPGAAPKADDLMKTFAEMMDT